MICSRCHGFVLEDGDNTRCLLCGHYPLNVPYPGMRDAYDRIKCRGCKNPNALGKTYCQHCLDVMNDYRKKKARAS